MPLSDGSWSHEVIAKATRRNTTKQTNLLQHNDTSSLRYFDLVFPFGVSWCVYLDKNRLLHNKTAKYPIVFKLYNLRITEINIGSHLTAQPLKKSVE